MVPLTPEEWRSVKALCGTNSLLTRLLAERDALAGRVERLRETLTEIARFDLGSDWAACEVPGTGGDGSDLYCRDEKTGEFMADNPCAPCRARAALADSTSLATSRELSLLADSMTDEQARAICAEYGIDVEASYRRVQTLLRERGINLPDQQRQADAHFNPPSSEGTIVNVTDAAGRDDPHGAVPEGPYPGGPGGDSATACPSRDKQPEPGQDRPSVASTPISSAEQICVFCKQPESVCKIPDSAGLLCVRNLEIK